MLIGNHKFTDLPRLKVNLVLDDERLLALGEVEGPPQLGGDGSMLRLRYNSHMMSAVAHCRWAGGRQG